MCDRTCSEEAGGGSNRCLGCNSSVLSAAVVLSDVRQEMQRDGWREQVPWLQQLRSLFPLRRLLARASGVPARSRPRRAACSKGPPAATASMSGKGGEGGKGGKAWKWTREVGPGRSGVAVVPPVPTTPGQ